MNFIMLVTLFCKTQFDQSACYDKMIKCQNKYLETSPYQILDEELFVKCIKIEKMIRNNE